MSRQLVAILVADVAGYSSRMRDDGEETVIAMASLREDIILPTISRWEGRCANLTGDGVRAVFSTCSSAAECAREIQKLNTETFGDAALHLRIGLSLGDVVSDGTEIHGHGLNMAVRVEALAPPGGIAVTSHFRAALQGNTAIPFRSIGKRRLKNMGKPVEIFVIGMPEIAFSTMISASLRRMMAFATAIILVGLLFVFLSRGLPAIGPPRTDGTTLQKMQTVSVAALPLFVAQQDPEQNLLAEGLMRDVVTDLSRFRSLFVVAAQSSFRFRDDPDPITSLRDRLGVRFVISGSLQRDGNAMRLFAELSDTRDGRSVWSERFDFPANDLLKVQTQIAQRIVQIVGPISHGSGILASAEYARLASTPTKDFAAYDFFLKGLKAEQNGQPQIARGFYYSALSRDPNYAKAQARIAWTYAGTYWNGRASDPAEALSSAKAAARKAIEIDPQEPEANRMFGAVLLLAGEHEDGIAYLRMASEMNPNGADQMMWLGWGLTYTGKALEAIELMKEAYARNPYPPNWYAWDMAWAHFNAEQYGPCIDILRPIRQQGSSVQLLLATCYAGGGFLEEMLQTSGTFQEENPGFTIAMAVGAQPFLYPRDRIRYESMLRLAGIPDE